jgi:hypothetical protein
MMNTNNTNKQDVHENCGPALSELERVLFSWVVLRKWHEEQSDYQKLKEYYA